MQRLILPCSFSPVAALLLSSPGATQCGVQLLTEHEGEHDSFGRAVAVDGATALVGDESASMSAGTVHVYRRQAGVWEHEALLTAPDGSSNEHFGSAVAIAGDLAIVGALRESGGGAVYVFTAPGSGWTFAQKLEASDDEFGAYFGQAVALDGDRLAIGAPLKDAPAGEDAGAVYVFERHPSRGWLETSKLVASDAGAWDRLGDAVSLSGDTVVAGAYGYDTTVADCGAAYVFEHGPDAWSETLRRVGGAAGAELGRGVAIDGDVLAIGAPGVFPAGTTLVLERFGGAWIETATLAPFDGTSGDRFGRAVALDGDRLAVGAPTGVGDDGAAYVYVRRPGAWSLESELTDADATLYRGEAVAMRASDLLVSDQYLSPNGGVCAYDLDSGIELAAAPSALALDAGGIQQMTLATCPPAIGATVLLLGSLGGTSPGLRLGGGLVLPLNPDPYLTHTLNHPNEAPLGGSLQTLDATGVVTATFTLPPMLYPGLVGLVAHHAFVVIGSSGALVGVSSAVPLEFVATKTVWAVSSEAPADFPNVAVALASPAVKDGDTLLVDHSGGASFTLTKSIHLLGPVDDYFYAQTAAVSGVSEFTLAGMHARSLRVENVPGRGMIDGCSVGGAYVDDAGGWYYLGDTYIAGCDQLLITNSWFHGDDACYPEASYADDAVVVLSSRVVFADCELLGGNGEGEEWSCPTHYPTAGTALAAYGGSEITLAGTTAVGGVQATLEVPAVWLDASTARVRGGSGDLLAATAPAAAVGGSGAAATVSGVSVLGAPLPIWVAQPAEAEPFVRLVGLADGIPSSGEVHVHGPAGGAALVAVALQPALAPPPPPLSELLWFDASSVIVLLRVTTLGQDLPRIEALPPIPSLPGTTPIVQAWMPLSPAGFGYVTNPTGAVVRW